MNERSSQRDHEQEQEAVREAVLDYVEGVYEVDPSRIERSVHPDLAKRGFFIEHGQLTESVMSFIQFLEHTKTYNKNGQFPADAPKEIIIYEVLDHTASVKLIAAWGIDYMHLVKYNSKWMIVHVLWQTLSYLEQQTQEYSERKSIMNNTSQRQRTYMSKLDETQVTEIRALHARERSERKIPAQYRVDHATIHPI